MKTFGNNLDENLNPLGIEVLTGEACGLGMRILCDLTQEGIDLWQEFTRSTPTTEPWNSRGIKSVMATYDMLKDLWIFGMVKKGYVVVAGVYEYTGCRRTTTYMAFKKGDPRDMDDFGRVLADTFFKRERIYNTGTQPGTGLDNEHAFTGRTK